MFSSIGNFFRRHKKKFFVAGAVGSGIYLLGKYAQWKLSDWQERETMQALDQARRLHHFESNQRTCNLTVLTMVPTMKERLMEQLNSEELTEALKSNPSNKLELWEQLKIISFTRTVASLYGCSLLVTYLRIQLNIIGGYMYVDTLLGRNGTSKELARVPHVVQQKYLQTVEYLLGPGLSDLITVVQAAIDKVFSCRSLKEKLTLSELDLMFHNVRRYIERPGSGDQTPSQSLCTYMLPPEEPGEACQMSREELLLERLMQETHDMMESPDLSIVLNSCVERGFSHLLDRLADFMIPSGQENQATFYNPNDISLPVAKLIPIMNGLVHTVCSAQPEGFVQELILIEKLQAFSANVYEAFSQIEHSSNCNV